MVIRNKDSAISNHEWYLLFVGQNMRSASLFGSVIYFTLKWNPEVVIVESHEVVKVVSLFTLFSTASCFFYSQQISMGIGDIVGN